jgi:alpha-tubulin suppressor-like RCC1 family protein
MPRTFRHALAGAVSIALAAACGGEGSGPQVVHAAGSSVAATPSSAVADGVATVTLTATARDASGAPVAGRAATFAVEGAACTLSSSTATTGADGTATVTVTSTVAGDKDVSAVIDGVEVAEHATATFVPGPAASLVFTVQPTSAVAGEALGPAVEVTLLDALGNVATAPTVVSLGVSGDATLHGTATTTATGTATFADLSVRKAGSGYRLTASGADLTATSDPFSIGAGAPDPAGSSLAASPGFAPADATSVTLTATIGDRYGNPVAGVDVLFAASGAAAFSQPSASTADDGTTSGAVSALVAGPQTIVARVGAAVVAEREVTFTAPPPSAEASSLSVAPAELPADGVSAATATVTVRDRLGRAVPGAAVALAYSGTATIAPASATTDPDGVARFALTSSSTGPGTLAATVDPDGAALALPDRPALAFVTPTYRIGGAVAGLTGAGLVLATAGQPDLEVQAGATAFAFTTKVPSATSYDVTVKAQPAGETCEVLSGAGTVAAADVDGIVVECGGWKKVASGSYHVVAVRTDGSLYAWGRNDWANVGDGSAVDRPAPVLIGTGFADVAAGFTHSLALTRDGSLYAWGSNTYGQLGDGTQVPRNAPALVGTGFAAIAGGWYHTVAVKTDGTLWAWGRNDSGQVGDGTTTMRVDPTLVGTGYAAVAAGSYHSVAVKSGAVYAWGGNGTGQLGDGTISQRLSPTPAVTLTSKVVAVSAGGEHSLALQEDGSLYSWGRNSYGQLGNGSTTQRTTPGYLGNDFASLAAGSSHSLAVKRDGTLLGWGWNLHAQLGDGTSVVDRRLPVVVGTGFASAAAGAQHSLGLKADGSLQAWGNNGDGALGDGTTTQRLAPVLVGTGYAAIAAGNFHSAGVGDDGSLRLWGNNGFGQLGDGTTTRRYAPVLLGDGIRSVSTGGSSTWASHTVAIDVDGALHAWGSNESGQLGDGTTTARLDPTFVGSDFLAASAGGRHTVAVKSDGSLHAWGSNGYGQLGDGTTTARLDPTFVGSDFASVAAGENHTLALGTDGSLWAWGYNSYGQVGDGTTTHRHAPTPIAAGERFVSVAAGGGHSAAVTTDGELYAWGRNLYGQLGDGTTTQRTAPVLVGAGFAAVAAGDYHTLALKADGTLWAWGTNVYGQLGDGTIDQRTAPVLVGAGFTAVDAGSLHTLALRGDGSLWAWGAGIHGQLGDGLDTTRPQPVPEIAKVFGLAYAPNPATYAVGVEIAPNVPTSTGGPIASYAVSPALPDGLVLDPVTGVLSGTPAAPSSTASHVVTASGPNGTTTALLTITVN